jgi:hypothetical protein
MGLDMYAYVGRKDQYRDHWDSAEWDEATRDFVSKVAKPREIAYWRKHPNLHGWMEQLWHKKRNAESNPVVEDVDDVGGTFNGIELELTWEDLEDLERAVTHKQLPATSGFFFGNPSDEHYYEDDLQFIKNAKAELFLGLKVFYNSSW